MPLPFLSLCIFFTSTSIIVFLFQPTVIICIHPPPDLMPSFPFCIPSSFSPTFNSLSIFSLCTSSFPYFFSFHVCLKPVLNFLSLSFLLSAPVFFFSMFIRSSHLSDSSHLPVPYSCILFPLPPPLSSPLPHPRFVLLRGIPSHSSLSFGLAILSIGQLRR